MSVSQADVSRWWLMLRARADAALWEFFLRHPELVEPAVRRDIESRMELGERRVPSVSEVLDEARMVAIREAELGPPVVARAPGGARRRVVSLVPASDAEFRAGADEYAVEALVGFRREAFARWRASHGDEWRAYATRRGWLTSSDAESSD